VRSKIFDIRFEKLQFFNTNKNKVLSLLTLIKSSQFEYKKKKSKL
jgi:hypothetical protein